MLREKCRVGCRVGEHRVERGSQRLDAHETGEYCLVADRISEHERRTLRDLVGEKFRRARIHLGQFRVASAHQDLAGAVVEMNRRFNPAHPESGLLLERGLAYALMGDVDLAKHDLASAKKCGADASGLRRLEVALAFQR